MEAWARPGAVLSTVLIASASAAFVTLADPGKRPDGTRAGEVAPLVSPTRLSDAGTRALEVLCACAPRRS